MKARAISRACLGMLVIMTMAGFFLLPAVRGQSAPPKTAEPQKTTPSPSPKAIPVPEIATRATNVSNLLRTFASSLAPSADIRKIEKLLPDASERVDSELWDTSRLLDEQPTLQALQAKQQAWRRIEFETSGWLKVLTERAVALGAALDQLSELKQTWAKTLEAAQASKAPGPVIEQVQEVLFAIESARAPIETRRASVLDLQSRVSSQLGRCSDVLAQIEEAQRAAVEDILVRGSLPLWSPELRARAQGRLPVAARAAMARCKRDVSAYVSGFPRGIFLHLLFLVGLLALFCGMGRFLRRWETGREGGSSAITGLDRPYAAAFFCFLFGVSGPQSEAPTTIKALAGILAVAPMIRLTRPAMDTRVVPGLFALWILFVINSVRQVFAGPPLIVQASLVLETLVGIAVLGWFLFFGNLKRDAVRTTGSAGLRALRTIAFLALFILAAACVASVTGYLRLSRILTSEVIAGGIWALALYALLRVVSGVVAFALRAWPLTGLRMVEHHRDLLERKARTLLIWIAVVTWAGRLLDSVGLLQPTLSQGAALLATKLERGSISVSVGDIIAFFLTVWIAYLFSAFLRFLLREDVYPRIGVQRGASYALSSLLNYVIIALGFVIALGVIGVDLTKVTVLLGAFGVGIGFGLQSVVNNFVSGLILLFERPVHVGDTVEIGDLLGEVRRIGIRSSVVRTWQGADIIVPNADLISKQVTNWTLGDSLRRIDLEVGVNYGAEPKEVISVFESVAHKHPDILRDPPPKALFVGYGDSSINFQLRAWTDKFDEWPRIRSDLAVALYDAAHAAGMSFPFPQREVRVLHDTSPSLSVSSVDDATVGTSDKK